MYFVFDLFSHFKFFRENMQFSVILMDFILVTGDELNFRREAHVADKFRKYFMKYDYIKIPEIYNEFCTSKVIVMEYLKGDKISDRDVWMSISAG